MLKETANQQGFTILEAIVSLIVLISLMAIGANYMKNSADKTVNQNAAATLRQITEAAKNYVKDNYAAMYADVETGLEYSISLENENNELTNNSYLSKSAALTNSYGQKYKISIKKEAEGLMRIAVLTTSGEKMEDRDMMQTTSILGGDAGYISNRSSSQITGSQQAWSVPAIDGATVGHLATINYLSEKETMNANSFLHRTKVAGYSEWNTMETDIVMQENSINFKGTDDTEGLINSTGIIFKDGADSVTKTAQALGFESSTKDLAATKVTADYVKPGMIEMDASQVREVYTKADNICGDETIENFNKMFSIKVKFNQNIYSFICGKKDGNQLGSGRAYLHNFSGVEQTFSWENVTEQMKIKMKCTEWNDPAATPGIDNCADMRLGNASDKRNFSIVIKKARFLSAWYNISNARSKEKCHNILANSKNSQSGNLCQVQTVINDTYFNYEFNKNIINSLNNYNTVADKECTQAGIAGWNGDLQNIWLKKENDDRDYRSDPCKILKYHGGKQ